MARQIIRKTIPVAALGLLILGIAYGVAALISNRFGHRLTDTLFIEGVAILAIGLMMSMKGNPSGSGLQGLGLNSAPQVSSLNAEATRTERDLTGYHRNFLKHSIVEFAFANLAVLLGGVLTILSSVLFAS